jgi:Flp pilus assembly pilin Flp
LEARMAQRIYRFWLEEDGQDLIEYSLLIMFIGIACLWIIAGGRPAVNNIWTGANSSLATASTTAGS